jgi:hypothetical protein
MARYRYEARNLSPRPSILADRTNNGLFFVVQSIGCFTLQNVQKSLYLAGIFYQAYY